MLLRNSKAYWTELQERLKAHGFDPGPIDGERGEKTDGALIRFKASRGFINRPYVGPATEEALMQEPQPGLIVISTDGGPRWLKAAYQYLGLKEIPGSRDHPQIVSWWSDINAGFTDDETPWCGAFHGGVLVECGIPVLRSGGAQARAWEAWGQPLPEPAVGCTIVFFRNGRSSGSGHIGFLVGKTRTGNFAVLGGNQSDAVSITGFAEKRGDSWGVSAFRWPPGEALPATTGFASLPEIDARTGMAVT